MRSVLLVMIVLAGCALHTDVPSLPANGPIAGAPDAHCAQRPDVRPGSFRHAHNGLVASFGKPRHRALDLIAQAGDETQTIAGKLAYTAADTDLDGEDVELFACLQAEWASLGTVRSDGSGRFALALRGDERLPAGTHDLFAHVVGDGTGIRFLGFVARPGERVLVTDIDGTLTESENAIVNTVLFGDDIAHRRGAPAALAHSGYTVVYLSARGDQFTELTRRWLHDHGFPPGPIRLARAAITSPGKRTVAFKLDALRTLGVPVAAAIGNKRTDIEAYMNAGVPADRIFLKLPEFEPELREDLSAHRGIGFSDYRGLPRLLR